MPTPNELDISYNEQENDYYCGPASLQMAFDYFGYYISQKRLAKEGKTTKDHGTSREDMINVAIKNGFYAYVNNGSNLSEMKYFLEKELPVIVNFTEPSSEEGHYSIVSRISNKKIMLNDPLNGKGFEMNIIDFLERWHSNDKSIKWILVVSKNDINLGKQYRPKNQKD